MCQPGCLLYAGAVRVQMAVETGLATRLLRIESRPFPLELRVLLGQRLRTPVSIRWRQTFIVATTHADQRRLAGRRVDGLIELGRLVAAVDDGARAERLCQQAGVVVRVDVQC